jgi:hypothetical protein
VEVHLCWPGGTTYWQPETCPAKPAASPSRRHRHSRKCVKRCERPRSAGRTWPAGLWRAAIRWGAAWWHNFRLNSICFRHNSTGHDGDACVGRSGQPWVQYADDSYGRYSHDHWGQHHRRRQQDQQVFHHHLRQSEELSPLRIHLGSLEGQYWCGTTRLADGNGIRTASRSATRTESRQPAAESSTATSESAAATESAATVVIFSEAGLFEAGKAQAQFLLRAAGGKTPAGKVLPPFGLVAWPVALWLAHSRQAHS